MPAIASMLTNAAAAARGVRLRVTIAHIVRALEALRRSPADDADDSTASGDAAVVKRLLRNESFVTDLDRRYDTASRYERVVLGEDRMELDELRTHIRGKFTQQYGERSRTTRGFRHITDNDETHVVGKRHTETVHGRVTVTAAYSAESIVGGSLVSTATHAYLRIAGWVDCMAWGGWIEADAIRCEIALLMVRSHVAYAHTAVARVILASRMVDDYVNRNEFYGVLNDSGVQAISLGGPGSGIDNEV